MGKIGNTHILYFVLKQKKMNVEYFKMSLKLFSLYFLKEKFYYVNIISNSKYKARFCISFSDKTFIMCLNVKSI